MPFPELNALGFTASEDSKYFDETQADPAIRKEFDGGFVSTRPRFTRAPPRQITTGFTDINNANKELLFDLYDLARGGSAAVAYIHPVSGETLSVRITKPIKAKYVGMGGNHRWDVASIQLETI